jgi:autotransporter-associated beta strand protein
MSTPTLTPVLLAAENCQKTALGNISTWVILRLRRPHLSMKFALFAIFLLSLVVRAETPPRPQVPIMGWSSWNHFRIHIDEVMIREQADAMAKSGMKEAGYRFINIDDGFFGGRDESGNLFSYDLRFPSGMKSLADYIRSKGLKPGIYSEAGSNTCGSIYDKDPRGVGVGLYGHEERDLKLMLVDWGYDFIKVDWCGGLRQGLSEQEQYSKISEIVRRLKPTAVYNVCRWEYPGHWVKKVADSWRVSADIEPTFESVMHIVDLCEPLWKHSGPGNFNDMDMLQVGRGMSETEDRTHFTMWCMMNSPLLAGNDLRSMTPATLAILTHPELIAINQDPLAYQARRLRDDGDTELWARPLGQTDSGDVAVVLLNRGKSSADIAFDLTEVGIDASGSYAIRDLWQRKTLQSASRLARASFAVPAHGVVALRIKGRPTSQDLFARPRTLRWDDGSGSAKWNARDVNWSGEKWNNSHPDSAVFAGTSGREIEANGEIRVQDIRFQTAGYHLTGGSIQVSGAGETFITTDSDAVVSSTFVGGLLRKDGPATLTLLGSNLHAGGTVIEEGTLEVHTLADHSSNIGSGWLSIDRNSRLRFLGRGSESTSREIWSNNLSGTRTIEVVHPGASLVLSGDKGEISRPLRKTGNGALTIERTISGAASVEVDGGVLTLSGPNHYTGDTSVRKGQLVLKRPSLADQSAVIIAQHGKLALDFTGEDRVAKVVLGGTVHTSPGRYHAGNFPAYFSGTGSLLIP